jgi:hypothetical protein
MTLCVAPAVIQSRKGSKMLRASEAKEKNSFSEDFVLPDKSERSAGR